MYKAPPPTLPGLQKGSGSLSPPWRILSDTVAAFPRQIDPPRICGQACGRSAKKRRAPDRCPFQRCRPPKADTPRALTPAACKIPEFLYLPDTDFSIFPSFRQEKSLSRHTSSSYLMQVFRHLAVTFPQTQNGHEWKNSPCLSLHVHFMIVINSPPPVSRLQSP